MRFMQIENTIINLGLVTDCNFQKGERDSRLTIYFTGGNPQEDSRTYRGRKAEIVWSALQSQCDDIVNLEPLQTEEGRNPAMARTMAELITPRQLVAVRGIANSNKLDAESICKERFKCKPEELNRAAASLLIDHLKHGQGTRERCESDEYGREDIQLDGVYEARADIGDFAELD